MLFLDEPTTGLDPRSGSDLWGAARPLHHPVLSTILWSLAITAMIAPFALRAYARRTSD